MSNQLTIGERPNKKNVESLDLTQKVNILRLLRGNVYFHKCDFPPCRDHKTVNKKKT